MAVLFHTPTVPLETCVSAKKTKPQRRDSYQPRESGDHSKRCTLMGEGSMAGIVVEVMVRRMAVVELDVLDGTVGVAFAAVEEGVTEGGGEGGIEESLGVSSAMRTRIV